MVDGVQFLTFEVVVVVEVEVGYDVVVAVGKIP